MALPKRHPIRILRRQRRPIAAVLAGSAVLLAVQAARPTGGDLVTVVVAKQEIPAGATIQESDLSLVAVPKELAPAKPAHALARPEPAAPAGAGTSSGATSGADPPATADSGPVAQYVGQVSAVAIARGELLHPMRLLSRALAADPAKPDNQPMPLRLPDTAAAGLLQPGNRIDVIAAASLDPAGEVTSGKVARVVARGVLVLSLITQPVDPGDVGSGAGTLALLSVSERQAVALSQAQAEGRITFTVAA